MPHDNVKVCEEVFGKLRANHMMSPTLIQIDRANPWSACSAAIITDFLDSGHGKPGTPSRSVSLSLLAVPATSLDLSSVTQGVHDPEEVGSEEGLPIPLPLASFSLPFRYWLAKPHLPQLIPHACPWLSAGDCLLDQPSKPIALPEDLPGASYSLSQQCELAFGVGSKPCPYMQYCTKLWCTGKAKGQMVCQTRHFPWADGTSCGEGKFCLKGTCVQRHNLNKYRVSVLEGSRPWGPPQGICLIPALRCDHICVTLLCCASISLSVILLPS